MATRAKTQRPRSPGDGRTVILHAAISEFAEQGFAGATTAAIARRAKVTQPLVHHHFGSKRKLWDAVLVELFTPLRETLLEARQRAESLPRVERLRLLIRTFIVYSGAHPELSRVLRSEASGSGDVYDALYRKWLEPLVAFFESELVAAIEDGTVRRVDPHLLYFVLVGAASEPFTGPRTALRAFGLDVRDPAVVDRYAELVLSLFLHGLLAR